MTGADKESAPRLAWLIALALVLLAARVPLVVSVDLFPDEAFFAWQALHAPFSFSPHPPGIALLIRAGMALAGQTEAGVRLFSLLFSTLTLFPVYWLARALGGAAAAFWATAAVAAMPLTFVLGGLATPDCAQLFFWSLALSCTHRALTNGKNLWWLLAGATVGVGLYVKYVIVLYFPSLVLCLGLSPAWRRHLRTAGPYLAALAAALLFAPVAAWQEAAEGWAGLRYQLGERHALIVPTFRGVALYQLVHAAIVSPVLYLAALWAMLAAGRRALRERDDKFVFLASFSVPIYLFFALATAVAARTHFREHWDAMVYVPALIAAAMLLSQRLSPARARTVALAALLVALLMNGAWLAELLGGWGSRLAHRPAFFENVLGWRQMAAEADRQLEATPGASFLFTDSYYGAVEYLFYGRRTARVYTLESRQQFKQGVIPALEHTGVSHQFLAREKGQDGIFVAEEIPSRAGEGPEPFRDELAQLCARVEPRPALEVIQTDRVVKRFRFHVCRNFDPAALDRFINLYGGPAGVIDSSTVKDGTLVVKGWAVDETDGAPVARLEIRVDGVAIGDATLGGERRDVARALGRDDALRSGWRFETPLGSLPAGNHEVTALATNRLGTTRRLSSPQLILVPATEK